MLETVSLPLDAQNSNCHKLKVFPHAPHAPHKCTERQESDLSIVNSHPLTVHLITTPFSARLAPSKGSIKCEDRTEFFNESGDIGLVDILALEPGYKKLV